MIILRPSVVVTSHDTVSLIPRTTGNRIAVTLAWCRVTVVLLTYLHLP